MLQVLELEARPDNKALEQQVRGELQSSLLKIANLKRRMADVREELPGELIIRCPRWRSALTFRLWLDLGRTFDFAATSEWERIRKQLRAWRQWQSTSHTTTDAGQLLRLNGRLSPTPTRYI